MSRLIIVGGRRPAEVTYLGEGPATSSGTGSVMDFAGVDFGTENPTRVVAIPVFWATDGSARTITAATIGGATAQVDQQQFVNAVASRLYTGIISAQVPTGTSGAVQITFSGSIPNNLEIHSYSIVNLAEYPTLVDADNAQASASTDTTLLLTTKAGGVVLGSALARNAGTAYTLTGITEDFDTTIFSGDFRKAGGSAEVASADISYPVRFQNANNNGAVIAVSYR